MSEQNEVKALIAQLLSELKGLREDLLKPRQSTNLLTLPETAGYLRIGQRTLERIVAKGELVPANVGERRLVFRLQDLERYVQKKLLTNAN